MPPNFQSGVRSLDISWKITDGESMLKVMLKSNVSESIYICYINIYGLEDLDVGPCTY